MKMLAKVLIRALILAPLTGGLIGFLLMASVMRPWRDNGYDWGFVLLEGSPLGVVLGLIFGVIFVWPTRDCPLGRAFAFLAGGTALATLPLGLITGIPAVWLLGPVGFVVGFAALLSTKPAV